jgi:hypothetical protein
MNIRQKWYIRKILMIYLIPLIVVIISFSPSVLAVTYPTDYGLNCAPVAQKTWYWLSTWQKCPYCDYNYGNDYIGCQWCWAASYTSAINYKKNMNYMIWDIVSTAQQTSVENISCAAGYGSTLPGLLNNHFGINSAYVSGKPTSGTVKSQLYTYHNPLLSCGAGHMTEIWGYHSAADFYIEIMDPWYGQNREELFSSWTMSGYDRVAS